MHVPRVHDSCTCPTLREYRLFDNSKHYKEKLLMTIFTFNLCFLIITTGTPFKIISMQTNNTIILGDNQFSTLKLVKVNLMAKPKEKLNSITPLLFNGYILSLNKDFITLCQKGQGKKINVIN